MPAFTDIAGVPMTANRALLTGTLRDEWGFDGVVISDYGAIGELVAPRRRRRPPPRPPRWRSTPASTST